MLTRGSGPRLLSQLLPPAALLLGVLCFAKNVRLAWPFTADDAWITLRYARHLAAGLGPVYNPGEADEGYTSPLHMLLLVLPHALGTDAVLFAKVFGVVATLGAAVLVATWPFGRDERLGWGGAVAAAGWLVVPRTALHAVSGMETALATLLAVALFRLATSRSPLPERAWSLSVVALLGGLTRPEFQLLSFTTLLLVGVSADHAGRRALLVAALSTWVMPTLLLESARIGYYRQHLPLPFYVKAFSAGALPGLPSLGLWFASALRHAGPLLLPGLLPLPASLRVPWAATLPVMLALLPFQPIMAFELRYLEPFTPVAYLTAGAGLERVRAWARHSQRRTWAAFAAPVLALTLILHVSRLAPRVLADELDSARGLAAAHVRLASEIAALAPRGLRLATGDAGVVPYTTGAWTLDLVGLNSALVARHGRRSPQDVFDGHHVNVLLLVSRGPQHFEAVAWSPYERPLADEATRRGWRCVAVRRFSDTYWLWLFAEPGSPLQALDPSP